MSRDIVDDRPQHKPTVDTSQRLVWWTTPLAGFLGFVCLPCTICGLPHIIPVRHEAVGTVYGAYVGTWKQSGLIFVNPTGLDLRHISINNRCEELTQVKVADGVGNPVCVSAVITYRVVDSAKATLDLGGRNFGACPLCRLRRPKHLAELPRLSGRSAHHEYVRLQAHASLKRVASRYPYITYDGTPSLITEQTNISRELSATLESKVEFAGLHIISFEIADLSYDRVIESEMLVRQHAQAVCDARKIMAEGALGIVTDLLEGLEAKGHDVSANPEKGRLITNLLTTVCMDRSPTQVMDIYNSGGRGM